MSAQEIKDLAEDFASAAADCRGGRSPLSMSRRQSAKARLFAAIDAQAAEIERLTRQATAYQLRVKSLEEQCTDLCKVNAQSTEARTTLASEREANAILTAEIERLKQHAVILANTAMHAERERNAPDAEHAAFYRWLQAEHQRPDPVCHLSWKKNGDRNCGEWVNTADLDAAIREAMKGQEG